MSLSETTFLLSQQAQLTPTQQALTKRIQAFIQQHQADEQAAVFVLSGDAGSGKSVVLNAVFTAVRQPGMHLLVNHNEMLKVYKEVAGMTPGVLKKDYEKPTPFINRMQKSGQKAKAVFVDEAHLLLSQPDPFNAYRGHNQLADLLELAHVVVIVEDFDQVVKLKSHWDRQLLQQTLQGHVVASAKLSQQFRLQAASVANWINAFVQKRQLLPLPHPKNFSFKVFEDGQPLYDWIQAQDRAVGLARMIATTDFPFRVFGERTWWVDAGNLHLPWDKINFTDRPWASRPETLHEVGSIYTIQGFDLNVAGVILGPSLDYDPVRDRITVDTSKFEDQEAFRKRAGLGELDKQALVLHVANILMKRGRLGLGLYAVNPKLRQRLLALQ
ncbi:DUF2075 domain-containing protein [Lacticaseibacillus sp. N501-2]|uniref:DUF2075 domain-containing protein n=1 Tax=Lacticaseibacillus salsurae TaxID=3367729 RepID=UPI0038B3350C